MKTVIGEGACFGFGGTNARIGDCGLGDVVNFRSVSTPQNPSDFFAWLATQALEAADNGAQWVVAGFPGPVSPDGKLIGPMANVPGMKEDQFDLAEELSQADSAAGRLVEEGFSIVAVNDGELAAQAAAARFGQHVDGSYAKVAALILGTGVGSGVVTQDTPVSDVYRADKSNPTEIGHYMLSDDPFDTIENTVSGPALLRQYGKSPEDLNSKHPAWDKIEGFIGRLALQLGLGYGVELVVPTGGIGAGASEKYRLGLRELLENIATYGNATQQLFLPDVRLVHPTEAQVFELFGAEGVMRDFTTRP